MSQCGLCNPSTGLGGGRDEQILGAHWLADGREWMICRSSERVFLKKNRVEHNRGRHPTSTSGLRLSSLPSPLHPTPVHIPSGVPTPLHSTPCTYRTVSPYLCTPPLCTYRAVSPHLCTPPHAHTEWSPHLCTPPLRPYRVFSPYICTPPCAHTTCAKKSRFQMH